MPDEVSTGELRRNIEDIRQDLRDRHAAIGQRLDNMAKDTVPIALFNSHLEATRREHDELGKDIAQLVERMNEDRKQRSADKRMILLAFWTSILAPIVILLVTTYLRGSGKGGAP